MPEPFSPALRFRAGSARDLPHCARLVWPAYQPPAAIREHLLMFWQELLEVLIFAVIEDVGRPYPDSIEAFGMSVVVSRGFCERHLASPVPYLATAFYQAMLDGQSPALSAAQIRSANSGDGIDTIAPHFGMRSWDFSCPRVQQVLNASSAAFYFLHAGYRLHCMVNEVYGPGAADYMQRGGFRLVKDFAKEDPARFAGAPEEHHPFLFAFRREWAEPGVVNSLSQLFFSPEPRFWFTDAERGVLGRALLNETDEQIARAMGLAPDTVKKNWRNILARASEALPHLFRDGARKDGLRGPERRRFLLEYLRGHLEEIRPFERR